MRRAGPAAVRRDPPSVALGGRHGLSATLRALRHVTHRLTAVVTVADGRRLLGDACAGSSTVCRQET